jgi:hypothetical protein
MLRLIGGTIAGIVAWGVIVTVLNLVLRHDWHDYHAVEKAMTFTFSMMIARLSISAVSSLASGFVAGWVGKGRWAPLAAGTILLLPFLWVHYSLWSKFPIWYHIIFLISLPLLSVVGGMFSSAKAKPD